MKFYKTVNRNNAQIPSMFFILGSGSAHLSRCLAFHHRIYFYFLMVSFKLNTLEYTSICMNTDKYMVWVLVVMTPKMWKELEHKIKFEDQEAHVISWLESTGGQRN